MTDRSELALQLTDAILAAKAARSGRGTARSRVRLSHRAQAALVAVDQGGGWGPPQRDRRQLTRVSRGRHHVHSAARRQGLVETTPDPEDDRGVRVTLTRHGLEVLLRAGQLEAPSRGRAIEGLPASSIARAVHLLEEFKLRLEEKQIGVVR